MSRHITSRLLLLFSLALLGGCVAVAPGLTVTDYDDPRYVPEGEDPDEFSIDIRPIDASLLQEQREQRREREARHRTPRGELISDYRYRIGKGDVLNVVVWGHPELSNPMGQFQDIEQQARLVREDGTIFFPFVGLLEVEGDTIEEVRERISRELSPYVENPQVDVRVVAFRSQKVYITGEVREPGARPLTDDPMTALDAINVAGGFGERADRRQALLTREGEQRSIDLLQLYSTGSGDLLLEDRDILHVPDNAFNKVFVVGEVTRQTSVPLYEGRLTLAEAISEADGLNLGTANTEEIYVMRGEPVFDEQGEITGVRPEVFHLNARSAVALVMAEGFDLQPRDIVYVSSSPVVRFNRVIAQILPTVQSIWQTQRILND